MSSIYRNRKNAANVFLVIGTVSFLAPTAVLAVLVTDGVLDLSEEEALIVDAIGAFILGVVLFNSYWKSKCSANPSPSMERKYIEFQAEYVAAKTSLRSSQSLAFERLPLFPFNTPYDDMAEETYERINIRNSNSSSLEAIANNALDRIRDELGGDDVYYMRGNLHDAVRNNNNSRALLIIEEVKQSGGELAIVAIVFSKRGKSVNIDIRNSAFPNTIHSKTPRRAVFAVDSGTGKYAEWSNYEIERYYLYFSPIGWTQRNDGLVPRFNQQTTAAAESLASAVYGTLKYHLE